MAQEHFALRAADSRPDRVDIGIAGRTAVWTLACLVMGGACILNALRCGRIHCYFTGPYFIAMAAVTLLFGIGVLPLGSNGWNVIGLALLAGGVVLSWVPELFLGRYRARKPPDPRSS